MNENNLVEKAEELAGIYSQNAAPGRIFTHGEPLSAQDGARPGGTGCTKWCFSVCNGWDLDHWHCLHEWRFCIHDRWNHTAGAVFTNGGSISARLEA